MSGKAFHIDDLNGEFRSVFSLASLTMISGFIGVNSANIKDGWWLLPIFFITVWNLSLLHLFLNRMYTLSIVTFVNVGIQAGLFVYLNGIIIGKVWLAAGLVLAWISGSIFFQVPNWLARKINV